MTSHAARGFLVPSGLVSPERRLVGVAGAAVWVAPTGEFATEPLLRPFDVVTGKPLADLTLETPPASFVFTESIFAYEPASDEVEALDLVQRTRVFRKRFRNARLRDARRGRLVLTRAMDGEVHLDVIDARSGEALPSHSIATADTGMWPDVLASESHAVVWLRDGVLAVDLESGRRAFATKLEGFVKALALDGHELFLRAASAGRPTISCVDLNKGRVAWESRLPAAVVGDALSGASLRGAHIYVVAQTEREAGPALLMTRLDRETGSLSATTERRGEFSQLPKAVFDALFTDRGIVDHEHGAIEYRREEDGRTIATRLPLPGRARKATLIDPDARRLFALGRDLVGIDLDSIPAAPSCPLALSTVGGQSGVAAKVTLVVGETVMLQHPVHGRTRVSRDTRFPEVAVGDAIIVEDVTVLPGGVVQVGSWRPASAPKPEADELVLDAPPSPKVAPVDLDAFFERPGAYEPLAFDEQGDETKTTQWEKLTPIVPRVERLFGEPLTVLRKLAKVCDASPATRERWERIGATFDTTRYETDLDDVSTLLEAIGFQPFARNDDHVIHGVVRDPKSGKRGVATLSPEGDHDLWWAGSSFDAWLAGVLANAEPPSVVILLLASLDLPESFPAEEPERTPSWFARLTPEKD